MPKKSKFYSLNRILEKNADYNIIFGERSNGKTFSVLDYGIRRYNETGEQMAIVRRWDTDFTGKRGADMFNNFVYNEERGNIIKEITKGKWDGVVYQSSRWYLAKWDEELEKYIPDSEPFAYGFAINLQEHYKSVSYPKITTILFDEFLTRKAYIINEFVDFMNIVSTIVRKRDNVKIFMCGNTVNKYCPYFKEMGLYQVPKMKIGDIDIYTYGDSELTVAVEYSGETSSNRIKKASDKYFAFDNPKLKMITSGVWEIGLYPHLPNRYKRDEVMFEYYIVFEDEKLHCEIISQDDNFFTYIHRKTTPIKDEYAFVFSTEYNPKPNYRRKINNTVDDLGRKIWYFYKNEKIFYQDNEVGEIVRNYINWCVTDKGIQ